MFFIIDSHFRFLWLLISFTFVTVPRPNFVRQKMDCFHILEEQCVLPPSGEIFRNAFISTLYSLCNCYCSAMTLKTFVGCQLALDNNVILFPLEIKTT